MRVTLRPIEQIRPYEGNPRVHDERQIEKLARLIEDVGWQQPIVIDEQGTIILGHGRYLAAQRLNMTKIPCHVAKGLTDDQIRNFRIADNRIAEDGGWDTELLSIEVAALRSSEFDLSLTMLSPNQLKQLKSGVAGSKDHTHLGEDEHIVLLECESEQQAQKLYEEMTQRGIPCRLMS